MRKICWERYPHVVQYPRTKSWLQIQANLGLAANTIEAYGRALEDYLAFCRQQQIEVETATKEHLSLYVRDLVSRPNPRGSTIRVLDSGVGLANATLQQRLTAIRLFYDYLIEEGIRLTNPVGRGRYTPYLCGECQPQPFTFLQHPCLLSCFRRKFLGEHSVKKSRATSLCDF